MVAQQAALKDAVRQRKALEQELLGMKAATEESGLKKAAAAAEASTQLAALKEATKARKGAREEIARQASAAMTQPAAACCGYCQ